jgi:hypothetical protein
MRVFIRTNGISFEHSVKNLTNPISSTVSADYPSLIRTGITSGFAGVKLSESPGICGSFIVSVDNNVIVIMTPKMSFAVN